MGIHVHLAVVADRVSDAAWHSIYEQGRRVAAQWTPRPLSLAWRQIGAERVAQYDLDIEGADGLHIVGDAETLATGESFVFPAVLDRSAPRGDRADPPAVPEGDVLAAVALRNEPASALGLPWCDVLGEQTQGLPYHALIVALGLLVEHALPGTAVVYGDISTRDAEQARRGLAAILGEDVAPPVVVDAERLRRRLAGTVPDGALDRAIRALGPPDPHAEAFAADLLGLLRSLPDGRLLHELEYVAPSCPDLDRLGGGTRELLHRLIEAIRSNIVLGELRERIEQWGAARTREAIARRTEQRGLRMTWRAWDALEAAGLDELAFAYGATCMDTTRWEVHQAVRAVLENRALRRA